MAKPPQSLFDADLWWYWNDAAGDMGLHAAPLEPSHKGQGTAPQMPGSQLGAASRYRDIEMALGELHDADREVLHLAHTLPPAATRASWGRIADIAHLVVRLAPSAAWVLERLHKRSDPELDDLVARAKKKIEKAITRFRDAHKEWIRVSTQKGEARVRKEIEEKFE